MRRAPTGRVGRFGALLAVVALLVVASPTVPANAQVAGGVVISELFYNPDGQAEGHEFIELHNTTGSPVDVSGWSFLTGITFVFPAGSTIDGGGYVVLAQNAVDFAAFFGFAPTGVFGGTLANGGENLTLIDTSGTVMDQVVYDDVAPWPLTPDGGGDSLVRIDTTLAANDPAAWVAGTPTPQLANDPNLDVVFSVQRGWYSSTLTVTLTPSVPGADIVYNTTGSGVATTAYDGPITVTDNGDLAVIQAQATLGGEASNLVTHTYVFKPDTGVPVVATWPNGLPVAPGETEATRSFEFLPPPTTLETPAWANAGVAPSSGGIDAGESDKFFFRGAYGNSTLTGDLFGDMAFLYHHNAVEATTSIDQLFLRDEHADPTHLRQIIAHDALLALGQLSPHGRFVQYYRSGTNSGVRHMQERPEGGFMESYTGIDKDDWSAWSTHETTPGSGTPNGLGGETMGAPFGTWAAAKQSIDVEALIDYLLVQWQAKVSDYRSIKNFRIAGPVDHTAADGGEYRYHFFNWDMDLGYNNDAYGRGHPIGWGWAGYVSPDYIAHDLDHFIEFRNLASDRITCAFFDDGPLTANAFDERIAFRRLEHFAAGGDEQFLFTEALGPWLLERNTWLIDEFRSPGADTTVYGTYRPDRPPWKPTTDFTGPLLQADAAVVISVTDGVLSIVNPNGGQVYYRTDGGDPRTEAGTLDPAAVAYTGPVGLLAGRHEVIARSFDSDESDPFQAWSPSCDEPAVFDVAVAGDPGASPGEGLVINEIQYHPLPQAAPALLSEFVELVNTTGTAINASGFSFSAGIDLTLPPGTVIGPGEHVTIIPEGGLIAYFLEYQAPGPPEPIGKYLGQLSDGGETLTLVDAVGGLVDSVSYDDADPWPTLPDGQGASLSLIDPALDNALAASWGPSRSPGTPGWPNDTGPRGDANCDGILNVADALMVAQFSVGTRAGADRCPLADPGTEIYERDADIDASGMINVADALVIAQCSVGITTAFC